MTRTIESGSRTHRLLQAAGVLVALAFLLAAIQLLPDYRLQQVASTLAWAVALLGLNLIVGFGGQMALGQSAFMGLGGYVTAILYANYGWNFLATLPVSVALGVALGFLFGLPALRIHGLYLALVTLALALAFPSVVKMEQLADLTGGANGKIAYIAEAPPQALANWLTPAGWDLVILAAIAALVFWFVSGLVRSRVGRAVIALRDNETGAVVAGVNPALTRTTTFAVGSGLAALGGSMLVLVVPIVGPDSGGFHIAVLLITGMVIGGAATVSGALVGAMVVVWLPELAKGWASSVPLLAEGDGAILSDAIYGALLLLVVFFLRGGIAGALATVVRRFVRIVPKGSLAPTPSSAPTEQVTAEV